MTFVRQAAIHRCEVCGKEEAWNEKWSWCPRFKMPKTPPKSLSKPWADENPIEVCSEECRAKVPPPKKGR